MIDIQTELFKVQANLRTIDTYQKFIRDARGTPEVHPYVSGVGGGEVHVYENGEVEVSIRNSGMIVLSIYSRELGFDHLFVEK